MFKGFYFLCACSEECETQLRGRRVSGRQGQVWRLQGSAGSRGCGVRGCGASGSSHKLLPPAFRYTPAAQEQNLRVSLSASLTFFQRAIEIYSLRVDCKVTSRFAHTVVTSKIVNRANESREATFEVELPKTAFITNFSM